MKWIEEGQKDDPVIRGALRQFRESGEVTDSQMKKTSEPFRGVTVNTVIFC